jgi:hypothetical protein
VTAASATRERYAGRIAGVGTTSGTRLVVGHWTHTSMGPFSDVMVERADGHRILLAPNPAVRDVIEATYNFDEVRLEPVTVDAADPFWHLTSPSLSLSLEVGGRSPVGWLLRGVPPSIATSTTWATLVDPVARRVLDGVRTRGTAKEGRREWYGATDVRRVTAASGTFDGVHLGALAPVDPPCRFGFSSTPRTPSVTNVVTTIETSR